jgi:hypothetical protein
LEKEKFIFTKLEFVFQVEEILNNSMVAGEKKFIYFLANKIMNFLKVFC